MGLFIAADQVVLLHEPDPHDGLVVSALGRALSVIYSDVIKEPIPQPLAALIRKLAEREAGGASAAHPPVSPPTGAGVRLYAITCRGCGSEARVSLEDLDPRAMPLRCLLCASTDIRVSELSDTPVP